MPKQHSTYTDAALILSYQKELNAEYIGELYKRYSLLVYGLAYKYLKHEEDAQDAVTEIFEIILEKLKTHEVEFFKSWLFILSKNYLMRRKSKNNSMQNMLIYVAVPIKISVCILLMFS